MGVSGDNKEFVRHKLIPIKIINKVMNSLSKISFKKEEKLITATGFFISISDTLKYLIINNHDINPTMQNIEIEIWNEKKIELNLDNRNIKYFKAPINITLIEIKNSDEIYNNVEFLDYDINYVNKDYSKFKDSFIFSIYLPFKEEASCSTGTIININNYSFEHNIFINNSSIGCPIVLLNSKINSPKVIGINKNINFLTKLNSGIFIGEIFKEISNDKNSEEINNFIIAEIFIGEENVNKDIRIINSYEEFKRKIDDDNDNDNNVNNNDNNKNGNNDYNDDDNNNNDDNDDNDDDNDDNNDYNNDNNDNNEDKEIIPEKKNEEEIKKCEIKINDEIIQFNYFHKFENKGTYIIKYSFNDYLTRANDIFCDCKSLKYVNLSNFNTQNITDMSSMFRNCESLEDINFSNINTQNVTDMSFMFNNCKSLKSINLSNFFTHKVTKMNHMFDRCELITELNLSNFITHSVVNMNKYVLRM